jgi:hypothetical protein
MVRRITPTNVAQFLFFMRVDQDPISDGIAEARPLDFIGLEDDVAVGENDHLAHTPQVLDHLLSMWNQSFGERVIDEERRHGQNMGVMRIRITILLQRS